MKYQGFYDSVISNLGVADRPYTAKQFCMYMKGLLGSGIGITNATGDNAWKVEKAGSLALKVTLGNNGYNFASLNGNPFAVDEEINLSVSSGTDRWDAIIIRANATSEVRATDVIVQQGNINITRNDDIYDLRLARVHIVNDVITEVIDDRLDNDYCGICDGLVTVPLDELRERLENVYSGNYNDLENPPIYNGGAVELVDGSNDISLRAGRTYAISSLSINGVNDSIFNNSIVRCYTAPNGDTYISIVAGNNMNQYGYTYYSVHYSNGSWIKAYSNRETDIVTGTFSISTTAQTINLGFKPRCVIINSGATNWGNSVIAHETEMVTTDKPSYIYRNSSEVTTLEIVTNGFKVISHNVMGDATEYGTGYRYIAFK